MLATDPARGFITEHAHYLDDAGFWQAHAVRLGGPVVELGAAVGRIAVSLAAAGLSVIAVDSDAAMLAVLMERAAEAGVQARITPLLGDMAHVALPCPTPLIIVPMNTLQVLVAPDDRRALFASVASALPPGGEFIFDLTVPDLRDAVAAMGNIIPTGQHRDSATGDVLVHSAVFDVVDPTTHTVDFRVIIDRHLADGSCAHDERRHLVHLYEPAEVGALVEAAGLTTIAVHAGFHGEPFDPTHAERQVWRCVKPGGPE